MNSMLVTGVTPSGRHAQTSVRPGSTSVRSPKKPTISSRVRAGTAAIAVFASSSSRAAWVRRRVPTACAGDTSAWEITR